MILRSNQRSMVKSSFAFKKKQLGQSMVEYTIVCSALFTSIYMANEGCPGFDNCIQALQVAMHDQHAGYTASLSTVHKYG